jgi:hypothetical protein
MAKTETRIEQLRRIVERWQWEKMEGHYLMDATTASALVTVYDAFKTDEAREKFETVNLPALVGFAFKHVTFGGAA